MGRGGGMRRNIKGGKSAQWRLKGKETIIRLYQVIADDTPGTSSDRIASRPGEQPEAFSDWFAARSSAGPHVAGIQRLQHLHSRAASLRLAKAHTRLHADYSCHEPCPSARRVGGDGGKVGDASEERGHDLGGSSWRSPQNPCRPSRYTDPPLSDRDVFRLHGAGCAGQYLVYAGAFAPCARSVSCGDRQRTVSGATDQRSQ